MGTAFARKYNDEQRDAVCEAWGERGVRPAERVAQLAALGELTQRGEPVAAFHIPAQTVRDIGRRYLKRRAGLEKSRALLLEPRDQVEALRKRLVSAAEHELDAVANLQGRKREVSPQRLSGLARAVREIAAIPTQVAPALAAKPEHGKDTRGGLAGSILRAARSSSGVEPVQDVPRETSEDGRDAETRASADENGSSARINTSDSDENASAPGRSTRGDYPSAHGLELDGSPEHGPRAA